MNYSDIFQLPANMKRSIYSTSLNDEDAAAIAATTPPSKKQARRCLSTSKKFVGLLNEHELLEETPPVIVISSHLRSLIQCNKQILESPPDLNEFPIKGFSSPPLTIEFNQPVKQSDIFSSPCHTSNVGKTPGFRHEVSDFCIYKATKSIERKRENIDEWKDFIAQSNVDIQSRLFQSSQIYSRNGIHSSTGNNTLLPTNVEDEDDDKNRKIIVRDIRGIVSSTKCDTADPFDDNKGLYDHSYLDSFKPENYNELEETPSNSLLSNCENSDNYSDEDFLLSDHSMIPGHDSYFESDWINSYTPEKNLMSTERFPQQIDFENYGECWSSYFQSDLGPNYISHFHSENPKIESVRLKLIGVFWGMIKHYQLSITTILTSVNIFHTLLHSCKKSILENDAQSGFSSLAIYALVSLRLASKIGERSDLNWRIPDWKDILSPIPEISLSSITIEKISKEEIGSFKSFAHKVMPAPEFLYFSVYLSYCKYPAHVTKEYEELGSYILGCTTFRCSKDRVLNRASPAQLAAASLILAVKILNYEYSVKYEFFPERLKVCTKMTFDELEPYVRGLSWLLKTKPSEAYYLKYGFAKWGDHDWR